MGNGVARGGGSTIRIKESSNNNSIGCVECSVDPHTLTCGHRLCYTCIRAQTRAHGGHLSHSGSATGTFPCQICGVICETPIESVDAYSHSSSVSSGQSVGVASGFDMDDKIVSTNIAMEDYISTRRENQAKRIWSHDSLCDIHDVALLYDRSLVYICQPTDPNDHVKTLHALDARGREEEVRLPGLMTSPQSVAASRDGRVVTILDRVHGDETVIRVFRNKPSVECWLEAHKVSLVVMQWLDKISPVDADGGRLGQFSCTSYVGNLVLTFSNGGESLWEYSLGPETPDIDGKCIDATPDGRTVVSCPKSHGQDGCVHILDKQGNSTCEFPQEQTRNPRAVCFTSHGHVVLADWSTRAVYLFSVDGKLIRKLISLDCEPCSVAILGDKYVAIGYTNKVLEMHQL